MNRMYTSQGCHFDDVWVSLVTTGDARWHYALDDRIVCTTAFMDSHRVGVIRPQPPRDGACVRCLAVLRAS